MIHRILAAVLLCAACNSIVVAQNTPVFVTAPNANAAIRGLDSPGFVAEYPVTPNIRAIAENALRNRPVPLLFVLPGGPALRFSERDFDPIAGFIVTDTGDLLVDPSATADDLSFNWYGVGRGVELSFTVHKGQMNGSVNGMLGRAHQAWSIVESRGRRVLRELDTSKFPPSLEHPPGPPGPKSAVPLATDDAKALVDAGGIVDILVLHTDGAVAQVTGGTQAALDAYIRTSIFDMQTALDNSQAGRVRIRNVLPNGAESLPVNYDQSPTITDPPQRFYNHQRWARTDPAVVAARNTFAADLVVMMIGEPGPFTYCGVAYVQQADCGRFTGEPGCGVGAGYDNFAFSVVNSVCPATNHDFAHEVGHQFGMEHTPPGGSPATVASFPWSYGHLVDTPAVKARTIMASFDCSAPGCPRLLHYSNPQVDFQAFPGTPSGTAIPDEDGTGRSRFNARTAVIFTPAMARFRGPQTGAFSIFGHSFEALPGIYCDRNLWPNCPQ